MICSSYLAEDSADLFNTFEKDNPDGTKTTVLDRRVIQEHKDEIRENINRTSKKSVEHALLKSIDALRTAMESHKDLEGDEKTRNEALKKVKELSRSVWSEHIYNPVI